MGRHLMIVPMVLVAAFTVRDDLTKGKILNRRILQGLAAGAAAYLLIAAAGIAGIDTGVGDPWQVAMLVLTNLGVGLLAGIVLWLLGVWAAGDAKLYALYAFLVPLAFPADPELEALPSLALLVNVFAFVFLFLVVDLARTGIPAAVRVLGDAGRRAAALRAAPSALLGVLPAVLLFTAMFAGIRTLREVSRETLTPLLHVGDFTMFLVLFAVFKPLMALVRKRWGAIAFTVLSTAALGWLVWRHGPEGLGRLLRPSFFAVALLVFARAYPDFGSTTVKRRVRDLGPGMILARETLAALRAREEREVAEKGEDALPEAEEPGTTERPSRFGTMTVEGLTAEQVRYIRTRFDDDQPVLVATTIPFSPFLAAGAIATWFVGGPVTRFVPIH